LDPDNRMEERLMASRRRRYVTSAAVSGVGVVLLVGWRLLSLYIVHSSDAEYESRQHLIGLTMLLLVVGPAVLVWGIGMAVAAWFSGHTAARPPE